MSRRSCAAVVVECTCPFGMPRASASNNSDVVEGVRTPSGRDVCASFIFLGDVSCMARWAVLAGLLESRRHKQFSGNAMCHRVSFNRRCM